MRNGFGVKGMDFLGVVGSGGRGIGWGGLVWLSLGVDGGTFIGDLSDVSVVVVGGVGNGLDSAVGKGNLVGSLDITGGIGVLSSLEVSLGVVIGNTVLESIGGRLFLALDIGSRGVVGNGLSYNNGGSVVGRGVDNGGGVVSRGVDNGSGVVGRGVDNGGSVVRSGVVDNGGSVVRSGVVDSTVDEGSVVDDSVATVVGNSTVGGGDLGQTLVVVSLVDGGVAGAESLGDLDGSHLTVSLKAKESYGW